MAVLGRAIGTRGCTVKKIESNILQENHNRCHLLTPIKTILHLNTQNNVTYKNEKSHLNESFKWLFTKK